MEHLWNSRYGGRDHAQRKNIHYYITAWHADCWGNQPPVSSYKTTLKLSLTGESEPSNWHLGAIGWAVLFSCPVFESNVHTCAMYLSLYCIAWNCIVLYCTVDTLAGAIAFQRKAEWLIALSMLVQNHCGVAKHSPLVEGLSRAVKATHFPASVQWKV